MVVCHGHVGGRRLVLLLILLSGLLVSAPWGALRAAPAAAESAGSEEAPADPVSVTTTDRNVSLDDLELMLEPMTRAEIEVEAKAWFALLRAKVSEISLAELAVHRKNREIAQLAKEKKAAEAVAKATEEMKSGQTGSAASTEENAAAVERLSKAQQDLAGTVDTAEKEAAQDKEKAAAAEKLAETKKAEAAKTAAAASIETPKSGDVNDVAVAAAEQKAAEDGEAKSAVSDAQNDASAAEAVKLLAETAPDSTNGGEAASGNGPALTALADRTSQRVEQLALKVDEATEKKSEVKVALVDLSTQLASERTMLADRLKLVLDKWELKGGDPTEYRQYIASLSGFKIDVSDSTATWARVKAWLVADEGGVRWARNFGTFLGYVLGSIVLAWLARKVLRRVMRATNVSSKLLRDFVVAMSGRAIVFVGALLGLSALEINLAPILAVVGAAGFVVAFALQGTLSNFASGLLIMVNKPFDVGDKVEIGSGIKGKVRAVSIFSTLIETEDGLSMVVPNNTVWSGVIINHSTGTVGGAAPEVPTAIDPKAP